MNLQLTNAGSYEAPQGKDFPMHIHTEWEIVCYCTGTIQTVLDTDIYETAPGILVLTPPGIAHAEYARTGYRCYYLGVIAPAHHPWPRICLDDAELSLTHLCRKLIREWHTHYSDRAIMLDLLLQQLDLLLMRAAISAPSGTAEKLVAAAERYMQEQYHRPLTISEIALALGISPATLRRHVMRLHGCAPAMLLQRIRVRHACDLLRTSDLTLEAIARLCGYDSASHLSRQVKNLTGKAPGALRIHSYECMVE
ncbi:hypothetical protein KDA_53440 [Dictyobacter alpinus]|uniref:HTH araC/xylS-type domain-containing protein n=1 Tax=Dictyobacter alpinus TaxID=2014873 RepID=A0A402BEZ3_9CHLR|nr:helix-turn-helix domain-containing protein [Dictyobacter alpinus]GCE29860.1 hypothetical protein KDA_53440 [Dictyobacter alpinus]